MSPLEAILLPLLAADEGTRLKVYDDANGHPVVPGYRLVGHPTIGTGRCLDTNGITEAEAQVLLGNDVAKVTAQLDAALPWWRAMSVPRQAVLASMAFQMGIAGVLRFRNTLHAMEDGHYAAASAGMLESLWARQTPARAGRLAAMLRAG